MEEFIDLIKTRYAEKKQHNKSYSLRAFSNALGLSPGSLSETLSGKRTLTPKQAEKIANRLELPPSERIALGLKIARNQSGCEVPKAEEFNSLQTHWWHRAILNLPRIENSRPDPEWIARYLAIEIDEAQASLSLLQKLKLIEVNGSQWKRTANPIYLPHGPGSKESRNKMIEIDYNRLKAASPEFGQTSDTFGVFFAADSQKIEKLKFLIKNFIQEQIIPEASTHRADSLYRAVIHLFPYGGKTSDS